MKLSTFDSLKRVMPEGGFTLSGEQLSRLQETLLFMLRDIAALAQENGLCITLGGGTALGAWRYGGFIPWDDDIDLNIPRADHDRLLALLAEQRADKYWIHTPDRTHNYGILSTRIRLKGTRVKMREDAYGDECGATIDLFPIEDTYDDPVRRRLHGLRCMSLGFLLSCRKFYRDRKTLRAYAKQTPSLRPAVFVKTFIGFLISPGSVDFWTRAADRVYRSCRRNGSRYVVIPTGRKHFFGELYRRSDFFPAKPMAFEGRTYACPADINGYLTRLYGDYQAVPAVEEQEKHVYFAFELPPAGPAETHSGPPR